MSRDGKISINFNQPLKVPSFLTQQDTSGRALLSLSEIDVSRDIVDVQFISRSSDESAKKEFYLDLSNWTEMGLEVKVNFTDPLSVS